MSLRGNGSYIGPRPTGPSSSVASGIWDLRTVQRERSANNWPGQAATDPDFASVSLLLHMDGSNGSTTFTDSSGSPKTVTANGGAVVSTAASQFGGASGLFSSAGDHLTVAGDSAFELGTGDFVVELWLRPTQIPVNSGGDTGRGRIAGIGNGACSTATNGWSLLLSSNQKLGLYRYNGSTEAFLESTGTVSANQWQHVAVSRSSGTVRFFIDGAASGSGSFTTTMNSVSSNQLWIGTGKAGSSCADNFWRYQGYIDDLRITKGSDRGYTGSTITVPTAAFPDA